AAAPGRREQEHGQLIHLFRTQPGVRRHLPAPVGDDRGDRCGVEPARQRQQRRRGATLAVLAMALPAFTLINRLAWKHYTGCRGVMLLYGLISSFVNDCFTNGGGFVGKGCVGHVCSPGISLFGVGRSSIGQIGSPVTRLKTYRNPFLLASATTSMVRPSFVIV